MAKSRGLGRGLDALLGGDEAAADDRLLNLSVEQLRPGKYQPRTQIDPEGIAELADSIKAQGIIQPILARLIGTNEYEIIAGERRWRAAKLAGLQIVPVLVREIPNELALAMALIENIQREDLNPLEEANGIQRLIDEFEMTHDSAASAVGRSRSAVTNLLRLLSLAKPVQDMLMRGQLDMGHARALLPLGGAKQIELANLIAAMKLSVRQTEELTRRQLDGPKASAPLTKSRDRDLVQLEEELADRLGTHIAIVPRKKGAGRIIIDYNSLDQLDGLLTKLR